MYFSSSLVHRCFERLVSRRESGKSHLERTSSILYFLAFDAVSKKHDVPILNLDPESNIGCKCRRDIEIEFEKLVLLRADGMPSAQVTEFGKVDLVSKAPDKRISSNFLTVPLKKASEQMAVSGYPRRPDAPVLQLGAISSSAIWGIGKHADWRTNFPKLLSEIKHPTPFTDLAVFVVRNQEFPDTCRDHLASLEYTLSERFTVDLSAFWIKRVQKERPWANHLGESFSKNPPVFAVGDNDRKIARLREMTREDLEHYALHLESRLATFGIAVKEVRGGSHDE